MTQTQPSLGRAKHQRGARCIYRDMTASELDRAIDTNAELLAALKDTCLAMEVNGLLENARRFRAIVAKAERH